MGVARAAEIDDFDGTGTAVFEQHVLLCSAETSSVTIIQMTRTAKFLSFFVRRQKGRGRPPEQGKIPRFHLHQLHIRLILHLKRIIFVKGRAQRAAKKVGRP